jgi:hypothetical protein
MLAFGAIDMRRLFVVGALALWWLCSSRANGQEASDKKSDEGQVVFTEAKENGKDQEKKKKEKEHGRPPFEGSELFMGRNIKPAKRAKTFTVGIKAAGAPFDFAVSALKDQAIKDACKGDQTCENTVTQGLDKLASVSDEEWNELENAVNTKSESDFKKVTTAHGISDDQSDKLYQYFDKACSDREKCGQALNAARYADVINKSKASILLGPYVDINLAPIEIFAEFPIVLVLSKGSTDAGIGNLNVELKMAKHFDVKLVNLGVGGGLHLYFPTGSKDSERAAFGFLFHAPRYLFGYLSWAPYFVVGMDSRLVTVQGYGELVFSHKVRSRDDTLSSHIIHARYGVGLTFFPDFFISLVGEINGLAPVYKSDDYLVLYGSGGLQFHLWVLKFGVAVITPIHQWKQEGDSLPPIYGVNVNQLSKFSLTANAALVF